MTDSIIAQECFDPLDGLNEAQLSAVTASSTMACFVHAGPGCGKTRVLTRRIAYLVQHHKIEPYDILAVTFTNKAAEEMKNRVVALLLGPTAPAHQIKGLAPRLSVGTFHSMCARFLKVYGSAIDIPSNFGIADVPDCKAVLKRTVKNSTESSMYVADLRGLISRVKMNVSGDDELRIEITPTVYEYVCRKREEYDKELRRMKLLDFDDLLVEMRNLLLRSPDTLSRLQDRFEHILVDEWQDTNRVQFDLVSLLARKRKNLFVVGDPDQSIYSFRGATGGVENDFHAAFPQALKFWLGKNYRSSDCIVQAAQHVIEEAKNRLEKKMVATMGFGNKINICKAKDEKEEAVFIAQTIRHLVESQITPSFSEVALLYRTNQQSRSLEEACINAEVPYVLRTGVRFYDRREIKDLVCYLRLIANIEDDSAFLRIVNTSKRLIGDKTSERVQQYASEHHISLDAAASKIVTAYRSGNVISELSSTLTLRLATFRDLMTELRIMSRNLLEEGSAGSEATNGIISVGSLLSEIVKKTQFEQHLRASNDDSREEEHAESRMENVKELIQSATKYNTIHEFLTTVALVTNADRDVTKSSPGAVSLMTLHGAKGLEYDVVFLTGVDEGLVPLTRIRREPNYEEERRLLYVGMTRAKRFLYMTWRQFRFSRQGDGYRSDGSSSFLRTLPQTLVNVCNICTRGSVKLLRDGIE